MGRISSEISRIINAKSALREAINAKGGSLTSDQLLDDYASAVANLSLSGGGSSGSGGTSGSGGSSGPSTPTDIIFRYPMSNGFTGTNLGKYVLCKGRYSSDWDYESFDWGGNFSNSTLLGETRSVLDFPEVESEMWEDRLYPNEPYWYWCEFNVDPCSVIAEAKWSISCCFYYGGIWNVRNNAILFGSRKNGGSAVSFQFYATNVSEGRSTTGQVRACLCDNASRYVDITSGCWYYLKLEQVNGKVNFYVVDLTGMSAIPTLDGSSIYRIKATSDPSLDYTLLPGTIANYNKVDCFTTGYDSSGDYRVFKLANAEITVG